MVLPVKINKLSSFVLFILISSFSYADSEKIEIKYLTNSHINSSPRLKFEMELIELLPNYAYEGKAVSLKPFSGVMANLRAYDELENGNRVNMMILPARKDKKLRADVISIPLLKGLLGFRKVIVRSDMLARMSKVKTIADLQTYKIGQVGEWTEAKLYRENGFKLVPAPKLKSLFFMLGEKRFDILPLGLIEIEQELTKWQARVEGLSIDPNLIIYYPLPVLLHITPGQEELYAYLSYALNMMMVDGSLDKLIMKHFGGALKVLEMHEGSFIYLENPNLPDGIPVEKSDFWLRQALPNS